jgi:hypothetical protein
VATLERRLTTPWWRGTLAVLGALYSDEKRHVKELTERSEPVTKP